LSLYGCIITAYNNKNLLQRYATEKTIVTALDGRYKPYNEGSAINAKLMQLFKILGVGTYSSPSTGIDYSKVSTTLCHILAKDFGPNMLEYMPDRYSFTDSI